MKLCKITYGRSKGDFATYRGPVAPEMKGKVCELPIIISRGLDLSKWCQIILI